MVDKETYINNLRKFESSHAATAPSWLRKLRESAIDRFAAQGFPTTRNEEWRFTRVRPLLQHDFRMPEEYSPNGFSAARLSELSFSDSGCRRLVFVNGHFAANLSGPGPSREGLEVMTLKQALDENGDLVRQHIGKNADPNRSAFVALNTAYLFDGAFIRVAKSVTIDEPIHVIFVSTATDDTPMAQPRNLIVVEDGSRATFVESYVGDGKGIYFTNAVTEMVIGADAHLDHYKVQRESLGAYHVSSMTARIGRDSRLYTDNVSLGGALVRNDVATILDGEGIECTLDGLYVADGHQHVDNHTNIEHARPHCESHELYKGILSGRAKGVFNGKIHVHPDAQKTDAKQSNGCILLSDDAQINTNPQLEIYADDVKCTHGATVGQIDESAVFYLRSRGIKETDAHHMLVFAFANEVLERIKLGSLRERLAADLSDWLSKAQS